MKINIMTKITLSVAAVVVVFGAAMIYVSHLSSNRQKESTIRLYEERGVAISKALDISVASEEEVVRTAQYIVDQATGKSGLGVLQIDIQVKAPAGQSPTGYWVTASNNPELIHTASQPEDVKALRTNTPNSRMTTENGKRVIDVTYPLHDASGDPIATASIKFDMSEVDKLAVSSYTYIVIIVMIAIALVVAVGISYTITSPLRKLTAAANELSSGNVDVTMPEIKSRDEIYELNESLKGVLAAVQFLTMEASSRQEKGQAA